MAVSPFLVPLQCPSQRPATHNMDFLFRGSETCIQVDKQASFNLSYNEQIVRIELDVAHRESAASLVDELLRQMATDAGSSSRNQDGFAFDLH